MTNDLDPQLLAILVCPVDKGPLLVVADGLYNPRLKRLYPIVDGIPNLLPDDAAEVDDARHAALMAEADASGAAPTGSAPGSDAP
jgi:uncharacterized protein YbaR (Trm112 family)